ncbi:hypothetical protein HDU89_001539 [Geranomyces variabilis]|nr:hypothetical protein HDU89_001539 [Geranomyces variabilis]
MGIDMETHFHVRNNTNMPPQRKPELILFELADENKIKRVLSADLGPWVKGKKERSPDWNREDRTAESIHTQVKSYMNNRTEKNTFKVEYYHGKDDDEGRLIAAKYTKPTYGKPCSSLQSMPSDIRNYIAGKFHHDIDIVNALPTIIHLLLQEHNIECPAMEEYVRDRTGRLAAWKMSKQEVIAKLLFFQCSKNTPRDLLAMHSAIYARLIPELQNDEKLKKKWEQVRATTWENGNYLGSFLSKVVFKIEAVIVKHAITYFERQLWIISSSIYDGFMPRCKNPGSLERMPESMLRGVEEYVKEMTNYAVQFAEKEMTSSTVFMDAISAAPDVKDLEEAVHSISGYENFDIRRLTHPSDKNLSEWFANVRGQAVLKHNNGMMFVLGRNNYWNRSTDVLATDLNCQIADAIVDDVSLIRDSLIEQKINVEELDELIEEIRSRVENKGSCDIAKNVARTCPVTPQLEYLFLAKPELIPFADCVYDLNTESDRPVRREDFQLFRLGYNFPRVQRPDVRNKINSFYYEIFLDRSVADFRLAQIASCLWGKLLNEHIYVLMGKGRNGKGVENSLIQVTFDALFAELPVVNLTREVTEVGRASPDLYGCWGARYIAASESGVGVKLAIAPAKKISAGDPHTARDLNGRNIMFPVIGPVNFQTNKMQIRWQNSGGVSIGDRQINFLYEMRYVTADKLDLDDPKMKLMDETLKTKFYTPEYRDEFMLMLIDRYHQNFSDSKKLVVPPTVRNYTLNKLANSLSAGEWFVKHYEITGNPKHLVDWHEMYLEYVASAPNPLVSNRAFYSELRDLVGKEVTRKRKGTDENLHMFPKIARIEQDADNDI